MTVNRCPRDGRPLHYSGMELFPRRQPTLRCSKGHEFYAEFVAGDQKW